MSAVDAAIYVLAILAGLGVAFAALEAAVSLWEMHREDREVLPPPSRDCRRTVFDEWA